MGKELNLVAGTRVRNIRIAREAWGRQSDGVPRVGAKKNLSGTSGFDDKSKRKFSDDSREDDNGADFTRKSASTITHGKFSGGKGYRSKSQNSDEDGSYSGRRSNSKASDISGGVKHESVHGKNVVAPKFYHTPTRQQEGDEKFYEKFLAH
jgi:hypothetical protein